VISLPQQEWGIGDEPQVCLDAYWPSVFALVNSLSTRTALLQKAVVIPAQFRCTSEPEQTVTGLERVYDNLTLAVKRSTSPDFEPPALASGGLNIVDNGSGELRVIVNAADDSGIAEIIAYVLQNGSLVVAETGPLAGAGPFTLDIPVPALEGERLVVQIVDGAGNVSTLTGKGANLRIVRVDAGEDQRADPFAPITFEGAVLNLGELISEAANISFVWEFGDGSFAGAPLVIHGVLQPDVELDVDGTGRFSVQHQYSGEISIELMATLTVLDEFGGVGSDDVLIAPFCGTGIDFDEDGVDNNAEVANGTDPCDPDTDADGFADKPATTHGVNANIAEDNCPLVENPLQDNSDGVIGNGTRSSGDDETVANSDALGDACDDDDDNDGLPDAKEHSAIACSPFDLSSTLHMSPMRADITNDDKGSGNAAPAMGTDAENDGPSWDTDNDGVRDGIECDLGTDPRDRFSRPSFLSCGGGLDADGDGLKAAWEVCKWGTSDNDVDSDNDGTRDCREVADVDGDEVLTFAGDVDLLARVFFSSVGADVALDIDGDGLVTFAGDVLVLAGFFSGTSPCL
jgi:hypothetical protein